MSGHNLVSLLGVFAFIGVAWLCSTNRRNMNWRVVGWGLLLIFVLAFLVFATPVSRAVFLWLNGLVVRVFDAAKAGPVFVFGPLALAPGETAPGVTGKPPGFILATSALPLVVVFAAIMSLLYYLRVMQPVIKAFAWFFTRVMRISGAESLCASSNIFVGIESATTVRPYLEQMTRSEFCTVLTASMATIASTVLALYVSFLSDVFPTIAGHLISASILSAPAAILISKVLVPEDETPLTLGRLVEPAYDKPRSAVEAVINGAMAGAKMCVGIVALLIAFIALLAIVNLFLGWLGVHVGAVFGAELTWSLQGFLGYVMYPFAVLLGVPLHEATTVASLLGERIILTELPCYLRLAKLIEAGALGPRAAVISAYALCGFAHVASMAIFVGGIGALVPDRQRDLVDVGKRAFLGAQLACFITGAVAGVFYTEGAVALIPKG